MRKNNRQGSEAMVFSWRPPEHNPNVTDALRAQIGNVTYRVDPTPRYSKDELQCYAARLTVIGSRGGKRQLNLGGFFKTIEEAQRKCEQHYAAGCDVSEAERL
jgi:hypothetical protein